MFTDAESARGAFLLAERDMFTTPRALAIRRAMKVESQDKAGKQERKGSATPETLESQISASKGE